MPASRTSGSPPSTWRMDGPMNCMLRSTWSETRADPVRSAPFPPDWTVTYCTSVNPSAASNSSATHWGARQVLGSFVSLIRVVSGGGSAAVGLGCQPRSPTVPASVTPPRNLRRLNGRAYWVRMETSLPDARQCDTENASQWTLLPSHEQAQHLTPCITGRSFFEFFLQLVEKPPVRALGDELMRPRLDDADLVQTQGVEA